MAQLAIKGGEAVIKPGEVKNWPPIDKTDEELIIAALHEPGQCRGKYTKLLEEEFCAFNGNKYAYFTNCGGSALQMCVAGCGIGAGDQVIVTSYTWPSSASCIIHNMAVPVFVCRKAQMPNASSAKNRSVPVGIEILPMLIWAMPASAWS